MNAKKIATVIGLAGSVCLSVGLFIVLRDATCSMSTVQSGVCDGVSDSGWWLMPLGLATAILASFAASPVVFYSIFAAVSIGSLAVAVALPGQTGPTPLVLGGIFGFVVLVIAAMHAFAGRQRDQARRIINEGKPGLATLLSVTDTGVTVNNNPRVKLHVSIAPQDGSPPFEVAKAVTVPRVAIPVTGTVYPVWYLPNKPTSFVLGDTDTFGPGPGTDARIGELLRQARSANTGKEPGFSGFANSPSEAADVDHTLARIGQLHALLQSGALTQEEFDQQKARLLGET